MTAKVDARRVLGELKRLREKAPEATKKAVGVWAENLVSEMKQEGVVPRDTGRLRDSHGWAWIKDWVVRVFANTTYAAAVHETHKTKGRWFAGTLEKLALPTLVKAVDALKKELGFK